MKVSISVETCDRCGKEERVENLKGVGTRRLMVRDRAMDVCEKCLDEIFVFARADRGQLVSSSFCDGLPVDANGNPKF